LRWECIGDLPTAKGDKTTEICQYSLMRRKETIDRLKATEPMLKSIGVKSLFLFGSHARDEAEANSDIDVFIEPIEGTKFGFDAFMEGYELLQRSFPGAEIGYGTRKGIDLRYMPFIEADAIKVF
jgi:uncharacterized protein